MSNVTTVVGMCTLVGSLSVQTISRGMSVKTAREGRKEEGESGRGKEGGRREEREGREGGSLT